jgi:hypothetical protein
VAQLYQLENRTVQNGLNWDPPPVDQLVDGHDAVDDAVAVARRREQLAKVAQVTSIMKAGSSKRCTGLVYRKGCPLPKVEGFRPPQYHKMPDGSLMKNGTHNEPQFVMRQEPISETGQLIVLGEIFDDLLALSFEGLI